MSKRLGFLVRALLAPGGNTSQRIVRGGIWAFASYGLQQSLYFVRSVILARLLMPADFGLMGLAALSTAALLVFTQTGIAPALVQRRDLDRDTLDTAWVISAVRGLLLGVVVVVLAPLVSHFFQEPLLAPVLRVMSLPFILGGFNSLGLILLQRSLSFGRLAYFNLLVSLVNLCVSAAAAFFLRNVWALVLGELASSVSALILSYMVHDFRPRVRFVRERARHLLDFGRYITASGIITYLTTQGDDAYVGKVLGTESLGFYRMAYRLSNLPATSISHVINRVTFPAMSAVQDDLLRIRSLYLQTLRLTALISIPIAGGMFALAPYLIGVLYGSKWMPVVPSFMVLCFFGLERSLGSIAGPVLLALGKPRLVMYVGLSKLVTVAICIVPLTHWFGILGTSIAVTASAVVVQMVVVPMTAHLIDIPAKKIVRQLLKPLGATLLMVVIIFVLRWLWEWPISLLSLVALSLSGFFVYALVTIPSERDLLRKLKGNLLPKTAV